MRDIAITAIVLMGLIWTIRNYYVGILMWAWITLMDPHQLAYGFSQSLQLNLAVAAVTLLSWFFSKERKLPPIDGTFVVIVLFLIWVTINSFLAIDPDSCWPLWSRNWRIILLGIMVSITATNRVRIHALIAVWALSLLFYGVKGGGFTLLTGGGNHVMGPPNSTIGDNNQLALAILMALPLANYVRIQSANVWVRRLFLAGMTLSVFSILGSYSRGAFIALGGLLVLATLRAKQKWLYPLVAAAIIIPAVQFMPSTFSDRMGTINDAGDDASFQGRVDAWGVAFGYARDHFPFGAGFDGPQKPQIFALYAPGKDTHAAHSIFFQVLGDNGFGGLALFLLILAFSWRNSMTIRRLAKGRPELAWAFDLAGMLQLSLFVFCLGGSLLSFAYYDGLYIAAGLLSVMREIVLRATAAPGWTKGAASSPMQRALAAPSFAD